MTEQSQSSIHMKFFHRGDILMKILKISKFLKNMKINKEMIREKKVKRRMEDACSTRYSSGNQVDGLPLVSITCRAGDSSHLKSNTKTPGKGKRAGGPARRYS